MNSLLLGGASGVAASGAMSAFLEALIAGGIIDREPPEIITQNLERKAETPVAPTDSFRARWISAHTAFGGGMGAVFGAMRDVLPRNTAAAGALFGAGLWTAMYPLALPAVGLYPKPDDDHTPRAWAIAAGHLIYGLSLAAAFDAARPRGRRRAR
jgi:uncharacterized membrane protein YagU involved in acid resistance